MWSASSFLHVLLITNNNYLTIFYYYFFVVVASSPEMNIIEDDSSLILTPTRLELTTSCWHYNICYSACSEPFVSLYYILITLQMTHDSDFFFVCISLALQGVLDATKLQDSIWQKLPIWIEIQSPDEYILLHWHKNWLEWDYNVQWVEIKF